MIYELKVASYRLLRSAVACIYFLGLACDFTVLFLQMLPNSFPDRMPVSGLISSLIG